MSDDQNDASGITAAFQAFIRGAASGDPELSGSRSKLGIIIGVATAVIIVIAVISVIAAG